MLIYVHVLAELSTIPALCVYKIKVLFAYSEIQEIQQTVFPFVAVKFCVTVLVSASSFTSSFPLPNKTSQNKITDLIWMTNVEG